MPMVFLTDFHKDHIRFQNRIFWNLPHDASPNGYLQSPHVLCSAFSIPECTKRLTKSNASKKLLLPEPFAPANTEKEERPVISKESMLLKLAIFNLRMGLSLIAIPLSVRRFKGIVRPKSDVQKHPNALPCKV